MIKIKTVIFTMAIIAIAIFAVTRIKAAYNGTSVTDETIRSNQKMLNAAKNGDIVQLEQPDEKRISATSQTNELNQEMIIAASNGNLEKVQQLVDKGADINAVGNGRFIGYTALTLAAKEGHLEIVKFLVEKEADVNATPRDVTFGHTALHWASKRQHWDIVRFLVENGADVNASATEELGSDFRVLLFASAGGNLDIVKLLVEKGADVNVVGNGLMAGYTALTIAAINGHLEIVKFLVDKGVDVNAFGEDGAPSGHTALTLAAEEGHLEIVKFLVEKGADVNAATSSNVTLGFTVLQLASLRQHWDIVKFLVENGANINASATGELGSGITALRIASARGNLDIVKFLVENGADVKAVTNNKNSKGETALMAAASTGHLEIVKFLVNNGSDINAIATIESKLYSALTMASERGHSDIVQFLVENGADVDVVTNDRFLGAIPVLMVATQRGHTDIVQLLVEHGADVNARTTGDVEGCTALTIASGKGYLDIVKFLVEHGADVNAAVTADEVEGGTATAIMIASQEGHWDIVKFLAEKGADVNATNREGKTTKDYAIKSANRQVTDYIETLLKYNPFTSKSYQSTFTYFTQAEKNTNKNTHVPTIKGLLNKKKNGINDIGHYQQTTDAPGKHLEITMDIAMEENKIVVSYGIDPQRGERNVKIPLDQQIFTENIENTHAYIIFPKEWKRSAEYQVIEAIRNNDGSHLSVMACSPEKTELSSRLRNYNAVLEGTYELFGNGKPQLERVVDTTTNRDEERRIERLQEKYEDYQIYKIPFYMPEGITQAYSHIGRSHTIYFDKSSLTGNGKIFIEIPQITFEQTASGITRKAGLEGLAYELDLTEVKGNYKPEHRFVEKSTGLKKKTIDLGDAVAMEFVYIPAGEFMMGSPLNEKRRNYDEGPQHRVKISDGFWMGVYEVTNAQYQQFVKESNYNGKRESNANYLRHILLDDKRTEAGSDYPVRWVSWNNACAFFEWLSVKEGKTYRLPTEAEWEYACRAGRTTELDIRDHGLFLESSGGRASGMRGTHSVGRNKPNSFGLYDMFDNVKEWCQDWYGSYSDTTEVDPKGPISGDARVVRGDYSGDIISYRCAKRLCHPPDKPDFKIGFRVVCEN